MRRIVRYHLIIDRPDEANVRVRLLKVWLTLGLGYQTERRTLASFEFDATGMGEDDILRGALADAHLYLGGGPDS